VKQNPDLLVHQLAAAADTKVPRDVADLEEDLEAVWYKAVVLVAVAVKSTSLTFVTSNPFFCRLVVSIYVNSNFQLPYTVGWQDLKDLFRQAGKCYL
jgi:hypothetical protein